MDNNRCLQGNAGILYNYDQLYIYVYYTYNIFCSLTPWPIYKWGHWVSEWTWRKPPGKMRIYPKRTWDEIEQR